MSTNSQICGFDFTVPRDSEYETITDVYEKILKGWTKKWVVQLEKGDSGYVHWQGRVSMIKKRRPNELKGKWCIGGHFSPTSNNAGRDFSYVMKKDTRIEGPYTDEEYTEPPPLTRQLVEFLKHELYPWQKQILDLAKVEEDRRITLIYDEVGNCGKSIFAEFMEYRGLAYEMPPFRLMEDMMQCAMGIPAQRAYMVDMPRGMKKDKLADFYSGLECLKNGVMYDKRYSFKKRRIDRPQIFVFTNTLPEWSLMSRDRWAVYRLICGKVLESYDIDAEAPPI